MLLRSARAPTGSAQMFWLTIRYLRILAKDPISLTVLLGASPMMAWVMTKTFSKETFALTFEEGGKATEGLALLFFMATATLFLGGFVASRCHRRRARRLHARTAR